jgi:hypothetical protein
MSYKIDDSRTYSTGQQDKFSRIHSAGYIQEDVFRKTYLGRHIQ